MIRCRRCGIESSLEAAFHLADSAGQRAFTCPRCWSRQHAFRTAISVAAVTAVVLLGVVAIGHRLEDYVAPAKVVLLGGALYVAAALLHELGHALPAAILGLRVSRISIGRLGPQIFAIRLFNCTLDLRLIPYGGATCVWPRNAKHARGKFIIATLCGPLVTLTLALGSLGLAVESQRLGSPAAGSFIFAAVNALLLVQVAIPRSLTIDSNRSLTDFLLAWETFLLSDREIDEWVFGRYCWESDDCQARADFAGAKRWILQGLQERPEHPECLLRLGFVDYDIGNVEAARQMLIQWLERAPVDSLQRPYVLNAIACGDLCAHANDLAAAERYSSEAVAAMPWIPEFQETRLRVMTALRESTSPRIISENPAVEAER